MSVYIDFSTVDFGFLHVAHAPVSDTSTPSVDEFINSMETFLKFHLSLRLLSNEREKQLLLRNSHTGKRRKLYNESPNQEVY